MENFILIQFEIMDL